MVGTVITTAGGVISSYLIASKPLIALAVVGLGAVQLADVRLPSVAVPIAVEAQATGKVHRIGFLGNSTPALEANLVGPFREGLRDLGYIERQNILIEYRWAEGKYERLAPSSPSCSPKTWR